MTLSITTRREWGADADSLPSAKMKLPAVAVYLHHSVSQVSTNPFADMRVIETIGMNRFDQFPYSWCVHPDGTILEGCGTRVGAHTSKRNGTSFGVALIGNYQDRAVKVQQLDSVRWLIAHLIAEKKLKPGVYPTGGHRDVSATACPGDNAYRALDLMQVPWTIGNEETPMTDNPELLNMEGPLQLQILQDGNGRCTGYAIFSISTGELHGYGPGWEYFGRSEDPTPGQ